MAVYFDALQGWDQEYCHIEDSWCLQELGSFFYISDHCKACWKIIKWLLTPAELSRVVSFLYDHREVPSSLGSVSVELGLRRGRGSWGYPWGFCPHHGNGGLRSTSDTFFGVHKASVFSDVNVKIYHICHSSKWESNDRSDIGRFLTFESNFILTTFPYIRTTFLFVTELLCLISSLNI